MNLFRTTAAVLALTTGLLTLPAHAEVVQQNTSGDPTSIVTGKQIGRAHV